MKKAIYSIKPTATLRPAFYQTVAETIRSARSSAYRTVNFVMVGAYWNIGRMIVEEEQQGKARAEYGRALIAELSQRLTREFGQGFDASNVSMMRQFHRTFPIFDAVRQELRWTHYRLLMRVEKPEARTWYMNEAAEQNWNTRALERQIHSLYYERLLASRDKAPVQTEARTKTTELRARPEDLIKDPYILEFLDLADHPTFREAELEQGIIDKLQTFLLELGKGFAFVARQRRIRTETKDFFIDLVFYNYLLKCFVLVDLKTGELTHQDIGQMDMYVRMFEDRERGPADNPTIGIILCTEKDETVAKYSVLKENRRLFASKYKLHLPTEQELAAEIEREKTLIFREHEERYAS